MRFPSPLLRGRLLRRYKRFFAEIVLDTGETIVAHCPNPGTMMGLGTPGLEAWVSTAENPKRKLRHTLELVRADGALVGINTGHPNRLVAEALAAGALPLGRVYPTIRREVRYGARSRVDFLLEGGARPPCYLEVKNVHLMREAGLAEFPDCVTDRGTRHLAELGAMSAEGYRSIMLYVVQRPDCRRFSLAGDIDPVYAAAFTKARAGGVEALAYTCRLSETEIVLDKEIEIAV